MKVSATASLPRSNMQNIGLKDLERFFNDYAVSLSYLKYEEEFFILGLKGHKEDIRTAVKNLHKEFCGDIDREIPLPESSSAYHQHYQNLVDKYLEHCAQNNLKPHPELVEDLGTKSPD